MDTSLQIEAAITLMVTGFNTILAVFTSLLIVSWFGPVTIYKLNFCFLSVNPLFWQLFPLYFSWDITSYFHSKNQIYDLSILDLNPWGHSLSNAIFSNVCLIKYSRCTAITQIILKSHFVSFPTKMFILRGTPSTLSHFLFL